MPAKWFNGRVILIEKFSPNTKSFTVELEDIESFDFEPGQFVVMDLPLGEKRKDRWRSYSIASAPNGSNKIEFCIVNVDAGPGTSYLFEEVKVGTYLKFKEPSGTFILPKKLKRNNIFISTGTGIVPYRSMMKYIELNNLKHELIHVIFGTRFKSGILYKDEFANWAKKRNVKYSIALSRDSDIPDNEDNITYHQGYVHSIYLAQYEKVSPDTHFYLCGWTNMIDDAVANLIIKMGYPKEQIHYELYG